MFIDYKKTLTYIFNNTDLLSENITKSFNKQILSLQLSKIFSKELIFAKPNLVIDEVTYITARGIIFCPSTGEIVSLSEPTPSDYKLLNKKVLIDFLKKDQFELKIETNLNNLKSISRSVYQGHILWFDDSGFIEPQEFLNKFNLLSLKDPLKYQDYILNFCYDENDFYLTSSSEKDKNKRWLGLSKKELLEFPRLEFTDVSTIENLEYVYKKVKENNIGNQTVILTVSDQDVIRARVKLSFYDLFELLILYYGDAFSPLSTSELTQSIQEYLRLCGLYLEKLKEFKELFITPMFSKEAKKQFGAPRGRIIRLTSKYAFQKYIMDLLDKNNIDIIGDFEYNKEKIILAMEEIENAIDHQLEIQKQYS